MSILCVYGRVCVRERDHDDGEKGFAVVDDPGSSQEEEDMGEEIGRWQPSHKEDTAERDREKQRLTARESFLLTSRRK